jgi:hypothetical protein
VTIMDETNSQVYTFRVIASLFLALVWLAFLLRAHVKIRLVHIVHLDDIFMLLAVVSTLYGTILRAEDVPGGVHGGM